MRTPKNVGTVIVHEDDTLLLKKTYKDLGWVSPGGHIDPGEMPFEAGVRELLEETGVRLCSYDIRDLSVVRSGTTEVYIITLKQRPKVVLSGEHSEYKWVNYRDVRKYALSWYQHSTFDLMGW